MQPDNFVVYLEKPTQYEIKSGLAHCYDRSGKVEFQRVMSVHTFMRSIAAAQEALGKWRSERTDVTPPISIGRKRE